MTFHFELADVSLTNSVKDEDHVKDDDEEQNVVVNSNDESALLDVLLGDVEYWKNCKK